MKIKITENDINKMVVESVKKILKENNNYNDEDIQWIKSEKTLLEELLEFLKRQGVETAHVRALPSGMPCLAIDTDEYHKKNVYTIADNFAKSRRRYVSDDSYPATTYIKLEKLM